MSVTSVVVHFGGLWINECYQGGQKLLFLLSNDEISYNTFLLKIQSNFVGVDLNSQSYFITCYVGSPLVDGGSIRLNITNDVDFNFALESSVREFFVNVAPTLSPLPSPQHNVDNVPINQESGNDSRTDAQCDEEDDDDDYDPCDDDTTDSLDDDEPFGFDPLYDDTGEPPLFHPLLHNSIHAPPIHHTSPPRTIYDAGTFSSTMSYQKQCIVPVSVSEACLLVDKPDIVMRCSSEPLSLGGTFDSKDSLMYAIGLYHLTNKCEFVVERSNPKKYYVLCKYRDRCQFRLRSVSACAGSFWRVTHWQAPHTCAIDLRVHNQRTMCSKVIGAFFAPRLLDHGAVLRPKEMASHLLREFGFQISYSVAWASRNRAIQLIYGDSDKSFQLLPGFLHMIQECNPGSVVSLQTDADSVFEYAFMALGASISGFLASGRPVIIVDATHLKGKFKGVMFVAASKDANEQIFPLAFGIGDKENDRSWIWFLLEVKKSFGWPTDLIIISDQHLSISKAVEVVYPGAAHGLCAFHIQKNLAKYGETVVQVFQRAATCARKEDLDKHMRVLQDIAPTTAFARLSEIDPVRWSNSCSPVRRYGLMTSNACENINSTLRWARTLPVCTLLECVRSMLCSWFFERREKALRSNHDLAPKVADKLQKAIEDGCKMVVEPINPTKYCVSSAAKRYMVDLSTNSCSCREFDLNLIPCAHAAAAISKAKLQHISYVSPFFTTKSLCNMYAGDVNPTPNKDEWVLPQHVKDRIVRAPRNPRQAGRPRTKRIPSHAESSRSSSRICSRCKLSGHYNSTCSMDVSISSSTPVQVSRKRKPKACSICRDPEHTKRKCPSLATHGT